MTAHAMKGDREAKAELPLLYFCGGFKSIYLWHLYVHQNCVIGFVVQSSQQFPPIVGDSHAMSPVFQNSRSEVLVNDVVFSKQNAQACGGLENLGGCWRTVPFRLGL